MRALLRHRWILVTGAALAALLMGLGVSLTPKARAPLPTPTLGSPSHAYSPFAVRVSGHPAFGVVTFKRVGADIPAVDDPSYEEVAESLAMSLADASTGAVATEVVYTPALMDPDNHVFCDANHLYVDYWTTEADGFGYSLWSGCGADDRFALSEVAPTVDGGIAALVRDITKALEAAQRTGCYRRAC